MAFLFLFLLSVRMVFRINRCVCEKQTFYQSRLYDGSLASSIRNRRDLCFVRHTSISAKSGARLCDRCIFCYSPGIYRRYSYAKDLQGTLLGLQLSKDPAAWAYLFVLYDCMGIFKYIDGLCRTRPRSPSDPGIKQ